MIRWLGQEAYPVEHEHHVLKNELATEALPSGQFAPNVGVFWLNLLTYNLLTVLKRLRFSENLSDARHKRLRFVPFNTLGKVVHHARCTWVCRMTAIQQALLAIAREEILALTLA